MRQLLITTVLCCLTACNSMPVPSPTPITLFHRLPFAAEPGLQVSPDGSMFAMGGGRSGTISIYNPLGAVLGKYGEAGGAPLLFRWLPDSSGLFVWALTASGGQGQLVVVDKMGRPTPTGLIGVDPCLSPDGAWIAAARPEPSGGLEIQAESRHDTAPKTLASDVAHILGWLNDQIVYVSDSTVYSVSPTSGTTKRLVAVPPQWQLTPPEPGPVTSPDGTLLVIWRNHNTFLIFDGNKMQLLSSSVEPAPNAVVFWLGPHDALADNGQLLDFDLALNVVKVQYPVLLDPASNTVDAVSGHIVAWTDASQAIHVANLRTGRQVNVGSSPAAGSLWGLAGGDFLLVGGDSSLYRLTVGSALNSNSASGR
jgi:hypothetical protein